MIIDYYNQGIIFNYDSFKYYTIGEISTLNDMINKYSIHEIVDYLEDIYYNKILKYFIMIILLLIIINNFCYVYILYKYNNCFHNYYINKGS